MVIINDDIKEEMQLKEIQLDEGFFFGKGVFETILVKDKPIFLEKHLQRLNKGLKALGINKTISKECILNSIDMIGNRDYALKIMVSDKNTILSTRQIPYKITDYEKGFSLKISEIKRNPYSMLTYIKSFNYIENILERERALKEDFNEVLFFNTEGYVEEGSTSNIFFIKDNVILTPKISCGILDGVIRSFLVSNIEQLGYKLYENNITLDGIRNSDGAFITNSLLGVMKVNKISNIAIPQSDTVNKIKNYYDNYIENT